MCVAPPPLSSDDAAVTLRARGRAGCPQEAWYALSRPEGHACSPSPFDPFRSHRPDPALAHQPTPPTPRCASRARVAARNSLARRLTLLNWHPSPTDPHLSLRTSHPPASMVRSKFKDEHVFGASPFRSLCGRPPLPAPHAVAPSLTSLPRCTEKRKAEAERIRSKYPDRIPVRPLLSSPSRKGTDARGDATGHLREGRQDGHPGD